MEEFDKWLIYSLTKDVVDPEQKEAKTKALDSMLKTLGGTISSTEQCKKKQKTNKTKSNKTAQIQFSFFN